MPRLVLVPAPALAALILAVTTNAAAQAPAADGFCAQARWTARLTVNDPVAADRSGTEYALGSTLVPGFAVGCSLGGLWALEGSLGLPLSQDVRLAGGNVGTVRALPLALMLQARTRVGTLTPYAGAGLGLSLFSGGDLPGGLSVNRLGAGVALGVGTDWQLDRRWRLNLDVRHVTAKPRLSADGGQVGSLQAGATRWGLGVGRDF
jgi:outer membrane protein